MYQQKAVDIVNKEIKNKILKLSNAKENSGGEIND